MGGRRREGGREGGREGELGLIMGQSQTTKLCTAPVFWVINYTIISEGLQ